MSPQLVLGEYRSTCTEGRCSRCHAPIFYALKSPMPESSEPWTRASGGPFPKRFKGAIPIEVDRQQNLDGNLIAYINVDGQGHSVDGTQWVKLAPAGYVGPRWISHAATCPKATPWLRLQGQRGDR